MADKLNIHQRLAKVMADVSYIQKEQKKGMQYKIVSHDKVTAKVRPALLDAGIVYYPVRCEHTHNGNRAECSMTVRFVNIDEPTDFFDVPTFGYGIDQQDKGPGKAMSYAVKYALLKALGLETGDDADHDNIDHDRKDPAKKPELTNGEKRDAVKKAILGKQDAQSLDAYWKDKRVCDGVASLPEPMQAELQKAFSDQMARVYQAPEAAE